MTPCGFKNVEFSKKQKIHSQTLFNLEDKVSTYPTLLNNVRHSIRKKKKNGKQKVLHLILVSFTSILSDSSAQSQHFSCSASEQKSVECKMSHFA